MKNVLRLLCFGMFCVLLWQGPVVRGQEILQQGKFEIGDAFEFQSNVLEEKRGLNVYLPQSYGQADDKRYPVIYLLDGSADEDFVHVAGLVQFGSFPWIGMLPESIVVGISNVDRKRDFTFPTANEADKKDFPTSGGSAKFIQMLEKEVKPLIQKRYRVNEKATVIGQSLGGLLVTEILFRRPELFDNYLIISPSLWWDDQSLLKFELTSSYEDKAIYVGVGKEGAVMEAVAKGLYKKLKSLPSVTDRIWFGYFEQLSHGDTLHLALYQAFENVFAKKADKATEE